MPRVRQRFEIPLNDLGESVRVEMVRDGRQVESFTVQYEALIEGVRRPVVRFDTAHGFAHHDVLDWQGATLRKDRMRDIDYAAALNEAIADVRANWQHYRNDYLRSRP